MRAAILPLICVAIAAAAALLPIAAAVDFPANVPLPSITFGQPGAVLNEAGDRLASWTDVTPSPFELQPQSDPPLTLPTFHAQTSGLDFHIEDAPSLLKLVNTLLAPEAPALNFAKPFTLFIVISMPASSACMQPGTDLEPSSSCVIVSAGNLASAGDFALSIHAGILSAALNTSATGAGTGLAIAAATEALMADTVTVVRVSFDVVDGSLELKYGDNTPFAVPAVFDAPPPAVNTTAPTWVGGPQPGVQASPPFSFFEGSIMELSLWPTALDATDDAAIFDYLGTKWATELLPHTPLYPGPLHAPDWILNASTTSGVTLNAEGGVASWDDTAAAYRASVTQVAPAVTFNALADAAAGAPGFDARLPAVVFGPGGLTVTPESAVHWNRASLFFALRVPATSACLQDSLDPLFAGCLIWSSTHTGLSAVGDIALTITPEKHFSVGVILADLQPATTVTLDVPIVPDVAIVLHILIDEAAGILLLTDGENTARSKIAVPLTQALTAATMLLGLPAQAVSGTFAPFNGGMLMELQAWIPSVETAAAVLTRQQRLDTLAVLKAQWAPTDALPPLPPVVAVESSSSTAADALEESSTGGEVPVEAESSSSAEVAAPDSSSTAEADPDPEPEPEPETESSSSSGSADPDPPASTIPASARTVLRFQTMFAGLDCSLPRDQAKIKAELSLALGIAQVLVAVNSSTAPPDNRIAIDLYSTASNGPPASTQAALRALWRRLLAIGGDPTDPALQIQQLDEWRTSADAPWKRDADAYPAMSQLDLSHPISAVSTSEAPLASQPKSERGGASNDNTAAVISSIVLIVFAFVAVVTCFAAHFLWKKHKESAAARSTANGDRRGGGAFGPEDPDRDLGERESRATDASGSRGLRRAAADGALRSPSYLAAAHSSAGFRENSLREPSGVGSSNGRLREVSLREARKTGGAGGSPLARGSRDNADDDDGADAEEAAVWAALSPESQAAQGRDPGLRLHSIELQPKAGGRKAKGAAAMTGSSKHVIASDFPVGEEEEEEEEDRFAARGAAHTHSNSNANNPRTKATTPVRLHD